jgi:hypothetical protein
MALFPIALALLQYIYTLTLLTPLPQEPQFLSRLLALSTTLDMPHLRHLVNHAMHLTLSEKNAGIYESAVRRQSAAGRRCVFSKLSFCILLADLSNACRANMEAKEKEKRRRRRRKAGSGDGAPSSSHC